MKKIKKSWIIFSVIIFIFLLSGIGIMLFYIPYASHEGAYVFYEGDDFSSNGKYSEIIDTNNDYPGFSYGSFDSSDRDDDYQAETEQERKNRSLLMSEIGRRGDVVYQVFEYQIKNDIYGLCNVFQEGKYIPSLPIEPEDIESVCFYKINPENDEITILLRKDSCIGLVLSENEAVYQESGRIMHYAFETGEEKAIYQINNEHDMRISIGRDALMVEEEKERVLPFIFPTDEKVKSVIQWK